MNVLTNAMQAIPEQGEITITTSVEPGDKVRVSFRDTGIGMSEDTVEKIFDPFFTTKDISKGTGLGMSITYGVVQRHNGDIQVKSKPGQGTEFIITLPVHLEKPISDKI
jgi:signal transduction histidine kinase